MTDTTPDLTVNELGKIVVDYGETTIDQLNEILETQQIIARRLVQDSQAQSDGHRRELQLLQELVAVQQTILGYALENAPIPFRNALSELTAWNKITHLEDELQQHIDQAEVERADLGALAELSRD